MSYRKALERLKAYEPKRLINDSYARHGDCCAVGAVMPSTRGSAGSICEVLGGAHRDIYDEQFELCITRQELVNLQCTNDWFAGLPEARYAHVLAWLEERVAKESQL